jgi:hypothetical protein
MALWDIRGTAIYVNKFRSHYIRENPRKIALAEEKNVNKQTKNKEL